MLVLTNPTTTPTEMCPPLLQPAPPQSGPFSRGRRLLLVLRNPPRRFVSRPVDLSPARDKDSSVIYAAVTEEATRPLSHCHGELLPVYRRVTYVKPTQLIDSTSQENKLPYLCFYS